MARVSTNAQTTRLRPTGNAVAGLAAAKQRQSAAMSRLVKAQGAVQEAQGSVMNTAIGVMGQMLKANQDYEQRKENERKNLARLRTNQFFASSMAGHKRAAQAAAERGESYDILSKFEEDVARFEAESVKALGEEWSPEGFQEIYTGSIAAYKEQADVSTQENRATILDYYKEESHEAIKNTGDVLSSSPSNITFESLDTFIEEGQQLLDVAGPTKEYNRYKATLTEKVAKAVDLKVTTMLNQLPESLEKQIPANTPVAEASEIVKGNLQEVQQAVSMYLEKYGDWMTGGDKDTLKAKVKDIDTILKNEDGRLAHMTQEALKGGATLFKKQMEQTLEKDKEIFDDITNLNLDVLRQQTATLESLIEATPEEAQAVTLQKIAFNQTFLRLADKINAYQETGDIRLLEAMVSQASSDVDKGKNNSEEVYNILSGMLVRQRKLKESDPKKYYTQFGDPLQVQKTLFKNKKIDGYEIELFTNEEKQRIASGIEAAFKSQDFNEVFRSLDEASMTKLSFMEQEANMVKVDYRQVYEDVLEGFDGMLSDEAISKIGQIRSMQTISPTLSSELLNLWSSATPDTYKGIVEDNKEQTVSTFTESDEWNAFERSFFSTSDTRTIKSIESLKNTLTLMAAARTAGNGMDMEDNLESVLDEVIGRNYITTDVNGSPIALSRIPTSTGAKLDDRDVTVGIKQALSVFGGSGTRLAKLLNVSELDNEIPFTVADITDRDGKDLLVLPPEPTRYDKAKHRQDIQNLIDESLFVKPVQGGQAVMLFVRTPEGAERKLLYGGANDRAPVIIPVENFAEYGAEIRVNPEESTILPPGELSTFDRIKAGLFQTAPISEEATESRRERGVEEFKKLETLGESFMRVIGNPTLKKFENMTEDFNQVYKDLDRIKLEFSRKFKDSE
jgi:hypothetical protein